MRTHFLVILLLFSMVINESYGQDFTITVPVELYKIPDRLKTFSVQIWVYDYDNYSESELFSPSENSQIGSCSSDVYYLFSGEYIGNVTLRFNADPNRLPYLATTYFARILIEGDPNRMDEGTIYPHDPQYPYVTYVTGALPNSFLGFSEWINLSMRDLFISRIWPSNLVTLFGESTTSEEVTPSGESPSSEPIAASLEQVQIGTQIWTVKNLETGYYRNGDPITEAQTREEFKNLTNEQIGCWCYYKNSSSNGSNYGKIYNFWAVMDERGLAPLGWHIPSSAEWEVLIDYIGGYDNACKKLFCSGINISYPNQDLTTNEIGLSLVTGGFRYTYENDFAFEYYGTALWTSSIYENSNTCINEFYQKYINFIVNTNHSHMMSTFNNYGMGCYVRCVKD